MQSTTTTVTASDGTALHTHRWVPDGAPKAVVQIAHGMAEHSAYAARAGPHRARYAVYAHDHRGHGSTASESDHGYFADENGWDAVVADMRAVTRLAQEENPGLPVFLLGHSMGSFLARTYVIENSRDPAGLVLSGTGGDSGPLGKVGLGVARLEKRVRGPRHVSALLDKLTFGQFNAAFKPNRTGFDWLSRDDAEVDAYVDDALAGAPSPRASSSTSSAGSSGSTTASRSHGCDATCRSCSSPATRTPSATAERARAPWPSSTARSGSSTSPAPCTRVLATRSSTRPTVTRSRRTSSPGWTPTCPERRAGSPRGSRWNRTRAASVAGWVGTTASPDT